MTKEQVFKITKILIISVLSIFIIVAVIFNWQIQHYKKTTFEMVLQNESLRKDYGIYNRIKPEDYGFILSKECTFYSKEDGIKLSGWFLPAKNRSSKKCILIADGRGVNRMKILKFLDLIKDIKLDEEYNIYLGDMRNSGKSDSARTAMGYKFAEDIYYSIEYLNKQMGMTDMSIYTFSMSAMGTAVMFNRSDLKTKLEALNIKIEKIIFDSPLSNVKGNIIYQMESMNIPTIFMPLTLWMFNLDINGYLDEMRLGNLLKNINVRLLILTSKEDKKTPYLFLENEMPQFKDNIKVYTFNKGKHVNIYTEPENKQIYTDIVGEFLNSK